MIKTARRRKKLQTEAVISATTLQEADIRRERWFNAALIIGLLVLGIHNSIIYFGLQIVPNADWAAFIAVGRELVSFELPTNYQRAPVLGVLQILFSKILSSRNPELLAGWILNAVVHPFTIVLLWLIGKKFIGRSAWFFAVIAILNAYVISMIKTPIVETVFLFFIVLTFYCIFRRSRWAYLFASVTSMLRYEGAMLIFAAFLIDVLERKDKRQRLKAAGLMLLSLVPLGLWAFGTFVNWQSQSQLHYIREIGTASGGKLMLLEFINLIWRGGFSVMLVPLPETTNEAAKMMEVLSKFFVGGSFLFGSIYGLYKKQWDILALLVFFVPYVVIHALHSVMDLRYGVPVFWIVFLMCLYGFKSLWDIINGRGQIPVAIVTGMQVMVLIPIVLWLVALLGYVGETKSVSPRSISVPYVAIGIAAFFYIVARALYGFRYLRCDTVLWAVFCLIIVSNQFAVAGVIKNGRQDAEFKTLGDWYVANAKPNEKMVTLMAGTLGLLVPDQAENFIHTNTMTGQNSEEFIKNCYAKGITYVVWDSRAAFDRDRRFYNLWHLDTIEFLSGPQSKGPFEYITTITENPSRYLHIFRLRPIPKGNLAEQ